jgi:hypothetical protein
VEPRARGFVANGVDAGRQSSERSATFGAAPADPRARAGRDNAAVDVGGIIELGAFAAVAGGGVLGCARDSIRRRARNSALTRRSHEAETAAREAALDDEEFDPDRVRHSVMEILDVAQRLGAGDLSASEGRIDERIIRAWVKHRRLNARRSVLTAEIHLVRVLNQDDGAKRSVDARVRVTLGRPSRHLGAVARTDERWTLRLLDDCWALDGYGPIGLLDPVLAAAQVVSPIDDDRHLHLAGVLEMAAADPPIKDVRGLIDLTREPREQMAELAVLDSRFSAAVIDAVLRELVDAWEDPVPTGPGRNRLQDLATRQAVLDLLRPPTHYDGATMIIRDAVLTDWQPVAISQTEDRPSIEVDLTVQARRYLTTRSKPDAQMPGSKIQRRPIAMRWTLALDPQSDRVWQLTHSSNPAADIPGAMP